MVNAADGHPESHNKKSNEDAQREKYPNNKIFSFGISLRVVEQAMTSAIKLHQLWKGKTLPEKFKEPEEYS